MRKLGGTCEVGDVHRVHMYIQKYKYNKRVSEGSVVHFSAHHASYYVEGMGECAKVRGLKVPLKKSRQLSHLTKRNI